MGSSANSSAAQKLLEELRNNYVNDLPGQLDELEDMVMGMSGAEALIGGYEALYRRVHSLKGTAGTYGLHIISTICHQLEDYLNRAHENPEAVVDGFIDQSLRYVDLMRRARELARDQQTDFSEIEQALGAIKSQTSDQPFSGLIVDASRTAQNLWLQVLADTPVRFSAVDNGLAALDRLLHEPFDILITGMELPSLNGSALISALRLAKGQNSHIKAVLVSSRDIPSLPSALSADRLVRRDAEFTQQLKAAVEALVDDLGEPHRQQAR